MCSRFDDVGEHYFQCIVSEGLSFKNQDSTLYNGRSFPGASLVFSFWTGFYWKLNNVFSLVKTIFYKLKNPRKVLDIFTSVLGLLVILFGLAINNTGSIKRRIFLVGIGFVLLIPGILSIVLSGVHTNVKSTSNKANGKTFFLGTLFITVLTGLLILSNVIAASPQEFVNPNHFYHPVWYLVSSASLAAGTFLVWMRVFYWLKSSKGKLVLEKMVWILCGVMLVNYMFFGTDLRILFSNLRFEVGISFTLKEQLFNLLVLIVAAAAMYIFTIKWSKYVVQILLAAVIAMSGIVVLNVATIKNSVDEVHLSDNAASTGLASFQLSKTGQNIIVLMLDRAINEYVPYLFQEKSELQEQFSGFAYYRNTVYQYRFSRCVRWI